MRLVKVSALRGKASELFRMLSNAAPGKIGKADDVRVPSPS
jgi:hypothetical protein